MIRHSFLVIAVLLGFLAHAQYKTMLTVAQDGSGDYVSIQAAIDGAKAFPDQRVTIMVKDGVYEEKVTVYSWNTSLSIIGESPDGVIITWGDHFSKIDRGRNSTFHTPTLHVDANDFYAENLTIINSAGPVGQAIALSVTADRCSFVSCNIQGYQDTLYVSGEGNRQYFKNCVISGTTDYIFGNATALFENCQIHSLSNSYITAASTLADSAFGLVFKNCQLTAAPEATQVYLGRPWRPYAKTVLIDCELGSHILPKGWHNWDDPAKERTVYYAEFGSMGDGAAPGQRVSWSRQLTADEAARFTKEAILEGWQVE